MLTVVIIRIMVWRGINMFCFWMWIVEFIILLMILGVPCTYDGRQEDTQQTYMNNKTENFIPYSSSQFCIFEMSRTKLL